AKVEVRPGSAAAASSSASASSWRVTFSLTLTERASVCALRPDDAGLADHQLDVRAGVLEPRHALDEGSHVEAVAAGRTRCDEIHDEPALLTRRDGRRRLFRRPVRRDPGR